MRCPVLTSAMVLRGATVGAEAHDYAIQLRAATGRYRPTRLLRDIRYWHSVWCYAMSGTGLAYAATLLDYAVSPYAPPTRCPRMLLRAGYAMSGTDVAYVATMSGPDVACGTMSGTDIACGGTRESEAASTSRGDVR
eukprot:1274579-Rhodomonas_salina.3